MKMLRRLPQDPQADPRQGAGSARLVPDHAILAGRVGRQYRGDGAVPALALCRQPEWRGARGPSRSITPMSGSITPICPKRITTDPGQLPGPEGATGTVGLLMMRSYVLSRYRALRRGHPRFEARGMRVLPAFAGGLDGARRSRPISGNTGARSTRWCRSPGSACGRAGLQRQRRRRRGAQRLDVPYIAAHPLEFQTLGQWADSPQGLARSRPRC
jgi:magnesium chelatase subunit H